MQATLTHSDLQALDLLVCGLQLTRLHRQPALGVRQRLFHLLVQQSADRQVWLVDIHDVPGNRCKGMKIRSTQTSRRWTLPSSGQPPQRSGCERPSERSAPPSPRRCTPSTGAPESAGPAARAPTAQERGENAAVEPLVDTKLMDECESLYLRSSRHSQAPRSFSAPLVCLRGQMSEQPADRRTYVGNV